jgi:hypothetical protein
MQDPRIIGVESLNQDPQCIGYFDDNDYFVVGNKQLPKLHKHFELFYLNRLHFLGRQKQTKAEPNPDMFKPKLSKKTVEIAANYRKKVAD